MAFFSSWFSRDCSQYSYTDYRYYTCLANEYRNKLYAQLPDSNTILNSTWAFLSEYKEWLVLAAGVTLVTYLAVRYYNSLPQYPKATLVSSLNVANLTLAASKMKKSPLRATITFCIDASTSMALEREAQVKKSVNNVLDSALKIVETLKGAQISIAIVTFTAKAQTICKPTFVTSENIEKLQSNVTGYSSNGKTSIMRGLEEATNQVEESAKHLKGGVNTLILLTDGDDCDVTTQKVQALHNRLKKLGAQLFAVGIGSEYKAQTLQTIAPSSGSFTGTYISTSNSDTTIEKAISHIYEQTVGSYTKVELVTSQLQAGQWSLDGVVSTQDKDGSKCSIAPFSEKGELIKKRIGIIPNALKTPLNLEELSFELRFKDPQGRAGSMTLPWNPNTIIDPKLF